MNAANDPASVPLAYPFTKAQKLSGYGRTKFYELIRSGDLPAKRAGRTFLILREDLEKFLRDLPPAAA